MKNQLFQCPKHHDEYITNYCCLKHCLEPLCPDCMDDHIKNHEKQHQIPEVDTLNRVKKMCQNKLRITSQTLQEELNRLKNAANLDPVEILNSSLEDLDILRQKLIDQVNYYFSNLKDEFTNQFNMSAKKFQGFKELEGKIAQIIEELNSINSNLDSQMLFDSIKTTSNLDSDSLLKFYDEQVTESLNKSIQLPIEIVFNDTNFSSFSVELKKIVTIGSKDVRVVTNEKYLSLLTPKKDSQELQYLRNYFLKKFKKINQCQQIIFYLIIQLKNLSNKTIQQYKTQNNCVDQIKPSSFMIWRQFIIHQTRYQYTIIYC